MKDVIIIGASGHGKVVADAVLAAGDRVLGFLDDGCQAQTVLGLPVLGKTKDHVNYPHAEFLIAIGNNKVRRQIAAQLPGARWHTAIHPKATVSPFAQVGAGTVIMAGAVVNPGAVIGRHCIVNTTAVVEHDNRIADFVHISVGAKLAGTVTVGEATMVGIGAVVRNNVSICGDCMVGAGAAVVKDITGPGTYAGVPARRLK